MRIQFFKLIVGIIVMKVCYKTAGLHNHENQVVNRTNKHAF